MAADIDSILAKNRDSQLQSLQQYLRIPSISAQGKGIEEACGFVEETLRGLGLSVRRIDAGGNPVVFAEYRGTGKTILFYNHYDVQPPDPLEEWISPPFEPTIRDGRLYARGVADNKANLMARIAGIQALLESGGPVPNIKMVVEGEEEVGSPHLPSFVEKMQEELTADLVIWESAYRDEAGRPQIYLGCKGLVKGELVATCANTDLHSSRAVIVPNPAWRLVAALSSIQSPEYKVLIQGFYDDCVEPDAGEEKLVRALPFEEKKLRENLGLSSFINGLTGFDLVKRYFYQPTFNICCWSGGYQGEGSKTVLPRQASVKFDIRLVPNMEPEDILAKLRRHLDANGFSDIRIRNQTGYPPARTPYKDPVAEIVRDAGEQAWGETPMVLPHMIMSGPMHHFRRFAPCIGIGTGHAESNIHAPNESVYVEDFHIGAAHVARVLERLT